MKNIILAASFIFLFLLFGFSQDQEPKGKRDTVFYKNRITTYPMHLINREIRLGYERQLSKRHAVRLVVGYQYPTSKNSYESKSGFIFTQVNDSKVSSGIYLGVGYNYIFSPSTRFYVSAEAFYSYHFYDDKYYNHCTSSSSDTYTSLQSMERNTIGMTFMIGKKFRLVSGNKLGLEIDLQGGFGLGYRYEETTVYERLNYSCTYDYNKLNVLNPPEIENNDGWTILLSVVNIIIVVPF